MNNLLERLARFKDNRGMMANLRCILVANKKHRAWPVLNRLGVAVDHDNAAFVAGLYATHPDACNNGNFGTTCKAIESMRGDKSGDDNKLTPTERRFQHLLSAEPGEELRQRVLRMVLMAKSQGVPANYEKLLKDLRYWNERTKTAWAASYWAANAAPIEEEAV
jgi:CRISPR system Cascade subunit CasB